MSQPEKPDLAMVTVTDRPVSAVSARLLSKAFGSRQVIRGFSRDFGLGLHALMGPNGVGKSTLLSLLAGATEPDAGEVHIHGFCLGDDSLEARRRLGSMPDPRQLYPFMTGSDLLRLVLAARDLPTTAADKLLEGLRLADFADVPVAELSEGTQRKFCVVCALVGELPVVFLDEPTSGLDDAAAAFVAAELKRRSARSCIVFATHEMTLVENLKATVIRLVSPDST